jgi:hypothetical protein
VTMIRAAVVSIGSAPPCPRVISLDETCRLRRKAAASGAINRARCIGNLWASAGGCRQTEEPSNGAKMHAAALVGEPASLPCRQPRHVDRARGIGGARPRNRPRPRGLAQDVASELLAHGAGWRRKLAAGLIQ